MLQMNVEDFGSKYVDIKGFTVAAISSPDSVLHEIIGFAELAANYLTKEQRESDALPMHPIYQLRDACCAELCRRHGDDYGCTPALTPDDREKLVRSQIKALAFSE